MENTFFGQYLLAEGIVTAPQLTAAVEYQNQFNARLGEYAVALGCISREEAERINAIQVERDLKFGEAAMELGLFDQQQLQEIVKAQRSDHVMLGQALSKLGYVSEEAIRQAFERFIETQNGQGFEIPPDHPLGAYAETFFTTCHQLLTRAWGLPNKPRRLQRKTGGLLLSDRNAAIALDGGLAGRIFVGVPHDVAEHAAAEATGPISASEDPDLDPHVASFAASLAGHFRDSVADSGSTLGVGEPESRPFKVSLPDATSALVVPFLTPRGQVITALCG